MKTSPSAMPQAQNLSWIAAVASGVGAAALTLAQPASPTHAGLAFVAAALGTFTFLDIAWQQYAARARRATTPQESEEQVLPGRMRNPLRAVARTGFFPLSLSLAGLEIRYLAGGIYSESVVLVHVAHMSAFAMFALSWLATYLHRSRERLARIDESILEEKVSRVERPEIQGKTALGYTRQEFHRIMNYITQPGISTGTIGLVGVRGVGKTILQNQVLAASRERGFVAFPVSCPPQIDEHEIITNLFDRLCHAALRRLRQEVGGAVPILNRAQDLRSYRQSFRRTFSVAMQYLGLALSGLASGVLGYYLVANLLRLLILQFWLESYPSAVSPAIAVVVAAGFAVAGALVYRAIMITRLRNTELRIMASIPNRDRGERLARLYSMTLRAIEILETERRTRQDTGAELSLAARVGMRMRFSRSEEVARKPLSLAGLIDEYIDYVQIGIVPVYRAVLVVIDELDRVINPNEIREFLRRIKSLLFTSGAYYLMSIAEDVVESFQLRSTSRKGEADSAFSELVRLPPLSCDECRDFFRESGEQITPEEAGDVIAVLSGGIPRDLMRTLRRFRRHPEEVQRVEVGPDLPGFIRREANDALGDFQSYVRHSPTIDYQEKSGICTLFAPWNGFDTLHVIRQNVLAYVRHEQMKAIGGQEQKGNSQLAPSGAGEQADGSMLSLEILVRLEVLDRLFRKVSGEGQPSQQTSCEDLRKVIERYSYSPFEALEMLGLRLPDGAGEASQALHQSDSV